MKKILKKFHLYFALIFCIPLILQGLTGAILTFQHKISDTILQTNHTFSAGKISDAESIIAAAKQQVSENFSAVMIKVPSEKNSATIVRFNKEGKPKETIEVLMDGVSLEILEVRNPDKTFFRIVRKFHENLLLPVKLGKNIVGFFGFIILFMAISGLILWWPKKGNLYRALTFKFSSKGKKFHRDLHAAIGFWFAIPLITASLTGIYLSYTPKANRAILAIFPGQDLRKTANKIKVEESETSFSLNEAIDLASSKVDDSEKFISANLPDKPNRPYRINFAPKNYHDGEPQMTVFVDQYKREIIEIRDPDLYRSGEKIISWQHAIHAGDSFGWGWRLIVFLVGFLPLFFAITGLYLWLHHKNKKYPNFG